MISIGQACCRHWARLLSLDFEYPSCKGSSVFLKALGFEWARPLFSVRRDRLLPERVRSDGVHGAVLYSSLKGVSRSLVCVHKLSRGVI